jgi:HEPN domain-containing protein
MLTKQEHIAYWIHSADEDWLTVEAMFVAKRYLHCLFWAHLMLEKLTKANWVKNHTDNIPPKVHNIVWLMEESGINLGEETMAFLIEFNRFQLSSRYPDYIGKIDKICTETFAEKTLDKVKEIKQCLLKMAL